MPLDFRYHLASLTAVFGALLIGILLGVAMSDTPGLSRQISKLREEFNRSQALREIDQQTNQFNERTQAAIVRDRLLNRNVALVYDAVTFPEENVAAVRRALAQSGATITAEVALRPALLQLTPEERSAIYARLNVPEPDKPGVPDLLQRLAQEVGSGASPIAGVLTDSKLIRVEGDTATPISTVVFLGSAPATPGTSVETLDVPFLRACAARKLNLAAAEPFDVTTSAIPAYRKVAPITVDNIDRAAGRIALILALSENTHGDYGYKKTAMDVAPEVE